MLQESVSLTKGPHDGEFSVDGTSDSRAKRSWEHFHVLRYDDSVNPDKPVHAKNVPTSTPPTMTRGEVAPEQIERRMAQLRQTGEHAGKSEAELRLAAESLLKAETESKPVAGTESRPYVDEPGKQLRSRTKVQDPSESAVQTRSAPDEKSKEQAGKLRNQ